MVVVYRNSVQRVPQNTSQPTAQSEEAVPPPPEAPRGIIPTLRYWLGSPTPEEKQYQATQQYIIHGETQDHIDRINTGPLCL
jgi:hypothetical protein